MKIKKIKGGKSERQILIAMIVDALVLSRIANVWQKQGLFETKWANLVGGWCVKHFSKYNKPPGENIERHFERWAAKNKDENTIGLVEELLSGLSNQYNKTKKRLDPKIELDHAEEYFNKVLLKRISNEIKDSLDDERVDLAQKVHAEFNRISLKQSPVIVVGRDYDIVKEAFRKAQIESLVKYRNCLGKFLRFQLGRNSFICFIAPDKRGKSFHLLDLAIRAWLQGMRVCYFDTGDMTEKQVIRRIGARCSNTPYRKQKYRYPTKISRRKDSPFARIEFKKKSSKKRLITKVAWEHIQKAQKIAEKEGNGALRLECFPAGTCSVRDIRAILLNWKREDGFEPDVICIDYADLLAPPPGINEYRHQINESWIQMRAASQELDCLVATATQANTASYKAELMGRWNFSEDKRKLAHVTGMIGLNSTVSEMEKQISRWNWIVLREGEFVYSKCVHVAQCLALANPAVRSCW